MPSWASSSPPAASTCPRCRRRSAPSSTISSSSTAERCTGSTSPAIPSPLPSGTACIPWPGFPPSRRRSPFPSRSAVARRLFGQRVALLTLLLLLISPYFLFPSATLLAHSTAAVLLMSFVYCVLRLRETPDALRWWLLAGVAVSWAALTRPFSTPFFAAPWLVWLALDLWRRRERPGDDRRGPVLLDRRRRPRAPPRLSERAIGLTLRERIPDLRAHPSLGPHRKGPGGGSAAAVHQRAAVHAGADELLAIRLARFAAARVLLPPHRRRPPALRERGRGAARLRRHLGRDHPSGGAGALRGAGGPPGHPLGERAGAAGRAGHGRLGMPRVRPAR